MCYNQCMRREIWEKLDSLIKDELVVLARKLNVKGYANLNKDQLKNLLIKKVPGKKLAAILFPASRKKWKRIFNMSAAIASIIGALLALYSIFFLPGASDPFAFTVRLRDADGVVVLREEGKMSLILHSNTNTRDIDKQGEAIFTGIPAKYGIIADFHERGIMIAWLYFFDLNLKPSLRRLKNENSP